jgi:two-component system, OmpR family, phosphate regulon response regulator OmpR
MQHILMIEDDSRLAAMVAHYLRQSGFAVSIAADGLQGIEHLRLAGSGPQYPTPHLVLLDLMLPDMDGLDVCRRVRGMPSPTSRVPMIMLTAKGDPLDRIVGLEMGADDYVPKPFEPRELLARIKAVLRRGGPATAGPATDHPGVPPLKFGSLEIDRDARVVRLRDKTCDLTAYQFDLLMAMAERAGRVLTRDQIMEAVRGRELDAFDRSIDVHMGRIRAAVEDDAKTPRRILTVRGVGYVFAKQQD